MHQKIGISLCGGAARGNAHIGVLKALEEHNIYPEYVAGASAGSIVGALYASGKTVAEIEEIATTTKLWEIFRPGFSLSGFMKIDYLKDILSEAIPHNNFDELPKKLWVAVSNLNSGRCEYLHKGEGLHEAVMASSSIPLIFLPQTINGQVYVDGGLLDNLPIKPIRPQCDILIGVNVNPHGWVKNDYSEMWEIGERTFELIMWSNIQDNFKQCDVAIDITGAYDYELFDFHKADGLIEAGYQATIENMPNILKTIL